MHLPGSHDITIVKHETQLLMFHAVYNSGRGATTSTLGCCQRSRQTTISPNSIGCVLADVECVEVGLVRRDDLLFGGVCSVTTVLKEVEELQQGLQEIEGE